MIEINGGKCVKLSSRCIVKTPLEASDIGKVSPRVYCDFILTRTSGDGGYFSHSILNSFPEVPKRVEFLNKFYHAFCMYTLDISNVKTLFQGGWMVKSVKHQDVQTFDNKAGIYLTCNELPDFGVEQPNVDHRVSAFHATELLESKSEAPQWIENNPMECLIWMINEINRNIKWVSQQEIFYEKPFNEVTRKCKNRSFPSEELEKLRSICVDEVHIACNIQ